MYSIVIGKDEDICANCKYFRPHYVRMENGFQCLRVGHCTASRRKSVDFYNACAKFELSEDEERFVKLTFEEV